MLPSTGYFKAINCPFYESGYCERPYCHFRHSRRDGGNTAPVTVEATKTQKNQMPFTSTLSSTDSNRIQQLVSEAVKKVLADENVENTETIVNKVVEGLKPKLVPATYSPTVKEPEVAIPEYRPTPIDGYRPTPIAELKKRHLPVPSYEPTRESKAVKRKSPDPDKPWMDIIRNIGGLKEYKSKSNSYKPSTSKEQEYEAYSLLDPDDEMYTTSELPSTSPKGSYDYNPDQSYDPDCVEAPDSYHPKPKKKKKEEYVPRRPAIPLKNQLYNDTVDVLNDLLDNPEYSCIETKSSEIIEYIPSKKAKIMLPSESNKSEKYLSKDDENLDNIMEKICNDDKENQRIKKIENKDSQSQDNPSTISAVDVAAISATLDKLINEGSNEEAKDLDQMKIVNDLECNKIIDKSKNGLTKSMEKSEQCNETNKEKDSKVSSNKNDSKSSKSSKNKNDSKSKRTKDEDSRHSKSKHKDKDRETDKEKDKDKRKEKDRHKHSSKSVEKSHSSSSKDSKSKEKDKDRNKEDKKNKEKNGSKEHKTENKDRNKIKTSSLSSKSVSSRNKDSHRTSSRSRDKHSKSNNDKTKSKESSMDKIEENSEDGTKCRTDSPDYEEFSPFFDENLLEASDSDYDVEEECRKIFQEYEGLDHPKDVISKVAPKTEVQEEEEGVGKKRIAHQQAGSNIIKSVGPNQPQRRLPNPQQRMYERWRMMREIAAEKAAEKAAAAKLDAEKIFNKIPSPSISKSLKTFNHHPVNVNGGKIRIAGVPYAMSLALEKKKVLENVVKPEIKTVAQTKKGARVAHIPQVVSQLMRPEPIQSSGTAKFPLNVRQYYINAMQDICVQIYDCHNDAAQRAVREELTCYEKCKAVNVYKNSCMLTIHRLRKEVDQTEDEPSTSVSGMISHEAVLTGKVKGSWSVVKPKKAVSDIKGTMLYNMLRKWIMTEQELRDNGYPRLHPDGPKGRAKIYVSSTRGQSTVSKVPNERICCRCNKAYKVDKQGFPIKKENCIYHHGRKFTFRGESKYMCCKQDGSSDGCCDAVTHVWDYVDVENLRGYVRTFDKENSPSELQGVYALDCEMCYTTQGLELTRVTVIDENVEVIYETLVKPPHEIIDFNTRFSGITEEDMKNVTTTLLDVQATLLSMFSSKTILIGHSLESDCKAMKLLHDTVIDTSVMFPHKNGPPFKRALRNLCSEYLQKIIQNDVAGHDSKEDAGACMELVLWKVKEEAKLL